jgi:pilus assembly protein CpaF
MNALAKAIPAGERLVVIEETTELQFSYHHVVRLEARPPSVEGRGEVTMRQLVNTAFHMRPDRMIVGEIRGEEALGMLQAMTTGHDGSMTTVHANEPIGVLDRLATMALMSRVELSSLAVERQVRSAIDLIVQLERFGDGGRRVTHLSEVCHDGGNAPLRDLFAMPARGNDSTALLAPTGARAAFLDRLARRGVDVPANLLTPPARFTR